MEDELNEIGKDYETISNGAIKTDEKGVSTGAICIDFD